MKHKNNGPQSHGSTSLLLAILVFLSCKPTPEAFVLQLPLGLEGMATDIPEDNPLTQPKVELGRELFFDERLSVDATISCASCHIPLLGLADGRAKAMGVYGIEGNRNTPTLINRVFSRHQFWDGRAASLEGVVLEHLQNATEMRNTLENVVKTISSVPEYKKAFNDIFDSEVTAPDLAAVVASFTRTIVSGNSLYDQFMAGDKSALTESAERGLILFNSERVNCVACHVGPNFTDEQFHNTGVSIGGEISNTGRFAHTGESMDMGKFKTQTLRDISRTAPYMHDGSLRTLRDVINFYNKGGGARPNLSKHIRPLSLSEQECDDLVNFLRSLSGRNVLFPTNS
jgi:cytochrome c peroxidase